MIASRPSSAPSRAALVGLLILGTLPASAQVPSKLLYSISAPADTRQSYGHLGSSVAIADELCIAGEPDDDTGADDAGSVKVFDIATGALLHVLANPSPNRDDYFGATIAVSTSLLVVGKPGTISRTHIPGNVYVYDLAGPTPTVPFVTLNHPDPLPVVDYFGGAVAIEGTRIVVGAYNSFAREGSPGSAYVFDLAGPSPGVPTATLRDPGTGNIYTFGYSVAISGTRIVVGSHKDNSFSSFDGGAHVFDLESATPDIPVAILERPETHNHDGFGYTVSISGTRVLVGAPIAFTGNSGIGNAFVYDLGGPSPNVTVLALHHPEPEHSTFFGAAVTLDGSRAVVGAYMFHSLYLAPGRAYVFDLDGATPSLSEATLRSPDPTGMEGFGFAVALDGPLALVGAPYDDTASQEARSAALFDLDGPSPEVPSVTLPVAGPAVGDLFGAAIALSWPRLVVGVPEDDTGGLNVGSARVYDLDGATPKVPGATFHNPTPGSSGRFGNALALSGDRVVVGAPRDRTGSYQTGNAFVYDLGGSTPELPALTLAHPVPALTRAFGTALAFDGTRIVVGAPFEDILGFYAGSACVFDLSGTAPEISVATLRKPNPTASDYFGNSVAFHGTNVVFAAPYDDATAFDQGSVYIYGPNPDDLDNDGLPDAWELSFWPTTEGRWTTTTGTATASCSNSPSVSIPRYRTPADSRRCSRRTATSPSASRWSPGSLTSCKAGARWRRGRPIPSPPPPRSCSTTATGRSRCATPSPSGPRPAATSA